MAQTVILVSVFDSVYKQACQVSIQDIFQDEKRGANRYEILNWNQYDLAINALTQDRTESKLPRFLRRSKVK